MKLLPMFGTLCLVIVTAIGSKGLGFAYRWSSGNEALILYSTVSTTLWERGS